MSHPDAILERAGVVDYQSLSPDQKKTLVDASISRLANFHAPSLSTLDFLSDVSDALRKFLDHSTTSQRPCPPESAPPSATAVAAPAAAAVPQFRRRRFDELPPDVIVSGILSHVQVFVSSRLLSALSRNWSAGMEESDYVPHPCPTSEYNVRNDSEIFVWYGDHPPVSRAGDTRTPGFVFSGGGSGAAADAVEANDGMEGFGGGFVDQSQSGSLSQQSAESFDFLSSAFAPPTTTATTTATTITTTTTNYPDAPFFDPRSWAQPPPDTWGRKMGSRLDRTFRGSKLEMRLGYCVERDPALSIKPQYDQSITWCSSFETIPKNSPSCSLFGYFVRDGFRYPWFLYRCVDMVDSEVRMERFLVIRPKTVERLKFVSHLRPASFPEMPLLRSLEIDLSSSGKDPFCSFCDVETLIVHVRDRHVVDVGNWRGTFLEWRRGEGMQIRDGSLPITCPLVLLDNVKRLRGVHLERVALNQIARLRNLRTLSLQDYSVAMGVDEFFSVQAFENLESLALTRVNCSFIQGDFRSLKNLVMQGMCRIGEDTFRKNAFPSLVRLKIVGLDPNIVGDGWSDMPSLKELNLYVHCPKLLDSLLQRKNRLLKVKLPGCSMENCSDWRLKTVTTLLLDSGASVAPSCDRLLRDFPVRLQDLRLHGRLCGEFAETFLSEVNTAELRHLIVERTNFDDRGSIDRVEEWMVCRDLRGQSWPDMPHLRTLKIRHCPLFGDSPFLQHDLSSLRVLDLRGCGRVSPSRLIHRSASAIFRTQLSAQVRRMLLPLREFAPNPPPLPNVTNALDRILLDGGVDLRRSENLLRREQEIRQRPLVFMSEALHCLRTLDSLQVKKKLKASVGTFQDHWERDFSTE